jgi:cytochrome c-type biogenesis protein CcmE
MKKIQIIAIILIAVSLAVIVSTISNSSTYAPFSTAIENEGKTFHVVGKVNLNKDFVYNPEANANIFGFYMIDNEGLEKMVLYNGSKPQDFERSEQIVVVGKIEGQEFHASQLLMKCPSKYNGNQQDQMKAVSS